MIRREKSYWDMATCAGDSRSPGRSRLLVEVVTDVSVFRSLEDEWESLALRSSTTIFQTFDWQYLWWKHFASRPDCHMLIVLFRADDKLIGIAPFFIQSYSLLGFRIFRRLKFLGSGLEAPNVKVLSIERDGPADYLDVIAEKGREDDVVYALADFLRDSSYLWDEIYLQNIPADSIVSTRLMTSLEKSGHTIQSEPSDPCFRVILPATYEEYLKSLKKKVRQHCRHACRTYFENPEYTVESVERAEKIDGAVQVLMRLHQRRWNSIGYPGLFADRRFESLHLDLAEALARKNRLWFKLLRYDGKPITAELGYKFNGRIYPYTSGFDHTYRALSHSSPGLAMKLLVIYDAIAEGYQTVDLARGAESYKLDLTSNVNQNFHFKIRPPVRDRRQIFAVYSIYGASAAIMSRVTCETGIMKVLAKEKGKAAIWAYAMSLKYRFLGNSSGFFSRLIPVKAFQFRGFSFGKSSARIADVVARDAGRQQ